MIEVINFVPAHFELFDWKDGEREMYSNLTDEDLLLYHEHGICFTAKAEGRVLLVGGVVQTTEYSGLCATFVSKYAAGHGRALLCIVRENLESIMQTMGLHRVETSNIKEAVDHIRWCRLLGFEEEGEMKYYDAHKRTYVRMAKFMEG